MVSLLEPSSELQLSHQLLVFQPCECEIQQFFTDSPKWGAIPPYPLPREPNMRLPGAISQTRETTETVEIPLLATPPGECNRISLRSLRSVHFWVGKR